MKTVDELPRREFRSRAELRDWLSNNHATSSGFWLVTFKKHVAEHHVPYDDVVEELLCFGWIDSRTRRVDDDRTMLLVGPRKPGGTWSASNKRRISRLESAGLLAEAGRAMVEAARADGSWTWLDDVENLVIPDDLAVALAGNPRASRHFNAFNDAAKKVILLWIKTARREETRANRIAETVRLAAKNVKAAHPEARGL